MLRALVNEGMLDQAFALVADFANLLAGARVERMYALEYARVGVLGEALQHCRHAFARAPQAAVALAASVHQAVPVAHPRRGRQTRTATRPSLTAHAVQLVLAPSAATLRPLAARILRRVLAAGTNMRAQVGKKYEYL